MKNSLRLICLALGLVMLFCSLSACSGFGKKTLYIAEGQLEEETFGIGFRHDDYALALKVQETLDAMRADGTAGTISKEWFGEDRVITSDTYTREPVISDSDMSLQKVLDAGKLVMGLDPGFAPMGYQDENNKLIGFDIDLAREVCKRLNIELVLQPISWDAKETELSTGRIDCIWNGMSINDGRVREMFIPKPYMKNAQVILSYDKKIMGPADLSGLKVGTQSGSAAEELVEGLANAGDITLEKYDDFFMAYEDLKLGRVDALAIDLVAAEYFVTMSKNN